MMSAALPLALAFDEFEARSYSVLAVASHAIVRMAKKSGAVTHYLLLRDLSSICDDTRKLLEFFHEADSIAALESASPEQLGTVPSRMRAVHGKIEQTVSLIRSKNFGYWQRLYEARAKTLEAYNIELDSHVYILSESQSSVLLLTKRDQDRIQGSLANPPKPNEALRRALLRK